MLKKLKTRWKNCWSALRRLSGDDAYEQYLAHYAIHQVEHHLDDAAPLLSREAFFKDWQDKKWKGVKRCC